MNVKTIKYYVVRVSLEVENLVILYKKTYKIKRI